MSTNADVVCNTALASLMTRVFNGATRVCNGAKRVNNGAKSLLNAWSFINNGVSSN